MNLLLIRLINVWRVLNKPINDNCKDQCDHPVTQNLNLSWKYAKSTKNDMSLIIPQTLLLIIVFVLLVTITWATWNAAIIK